jgi:hypothetical protein
VSKRDLFALTKREQRIVIVVLLALVLATAASRWSDLHRAPPTTPPASTNPTTSVEPDPDR